MPPPDGHRGHSPRAHWFAVSARAWSAALTFVIAFLALERFAAGQVIDQDKAYKVKAVYLYTILGDVTWPATAKLGQGQLPTIGVMGNSPIKAFLEVAQQLALKKNKRAFELRVFHSLDEVAPCHLLFISDDVEPATEQAVALRLRGTHTLIVSERPEQLHDGATLAFEYIDGRVHMVIDLAVARREELQFNHELLAIARITNEATHPPSEQAGGP